MTTTEPRRYGGLTLEELTALEAQATLMPWVDLGSDSTLFCDVYSTDGGPDSPLIGICRMPEYDDRPVDMACIAAARNALPDLIRRIQELEEDVLHYREAVRGRTEP